MQPYSLTHSSLIFFPENFYSNLIQHIPHLLFNEDKFAYKRWQPAVRWKENHMFMGGLKKLWEEHIVFNCRKIQSGS